MSEEHPVGSKYCERQTSPGSQAMSAPTFTERLSKVNNLQLRAAAKEFHIDLSTVSNTKELRNVIKAHLDANPHLSQDPCFALYTKSERNVYSVCRTHCVQTPPHRHRSARSR
jgi:hypothetical protein